MKAEGRGRLPLTAAFLLLITALFSAPACRPEEPGYCVAVMPAPVLNTADFSSVFGGDGRMRVKTDRLGLVRELEFVALPGAVFEIIEAFPRRGFNVYRVRTAEYPSGGGRLYIDGRFVEVRREEPSPRERILPPAGRITAKLEAMLGSGYYWGGNFHRGIEEMVSFYPPAAELDEETSALWKVKGVDCSGLLYEAARGYTPRNTSELVDFGAGVKIEGMGPEEIASLLEPLDIVVWAGHVIISLGRGCVVESAYGKGVVRSPAVQRLAEVMAERKPVDDWRSTGGKRFVVRRWHPEVLPALKTPGEGISRGGGGDGF